MENYRHVLSILCVCLFIQCAQGITYHLSRFGSDNNTCLTDNYACKTWNYVILNSRTIALLNSTQYSNTYTIRIFNGAYDASKSIHVDLSDNYSYNRSTTTVWSNLTYNYNIIGSGKDNTSLNIESLVNSTSLLYFSSYKDVEIKDLFELIQTYITIFRLEIIICQSFSLGRFEHSSVVNVSDIIFVSETNSTTQINNNNNNNNVIYCYQLMQALIGYNIEIYHATKIDQFFYVEWSSNVFIDLNNINVFEMSKSLLYLYQIDNSSIIVENINVILSDHDYSNSNYNYNYSHSKALFAIDFISLSNLTFNNITVWLDDTITGNIVNGYQTLFAMTNITQTDIVLNNIYIDGQSMNKSYDNIMFGFDTLYGGSFLMKNCIISNVAWKLKNIPLVTISSASYVYNLNNLNYQLQATKIVIENVLFENMIAMNSSEDLIVISASNPVEIVNCKFLNNLKFSSMIRCSGMRTSSPLSLVQNHTYECKVSIINCTFNANIGGYYKGMHKYFKSL